jgi:hypothetical protein
MNLPRNNTIRWLPRLGLFLPVLLAGCGSLDHCPNIPPGAIPPPTGTHSRRLQDLQANKAEADDFVIYKHEWHMGGNQPGPYGRYHLHLIAQRLPTVPFPVMIQADTSGALNQERRALVVQFLMQAGIADAEQRVVIGFPEAEGLYGEEGERIYPQMVQDQNRSNPTDRNIFPYGNGNGLTRARNGSRTPLGLGAFPF